ncbi:glycosyltransferase [Pedobacter sp. SYSU D00535]|uniref:glycosyltransferase n=1 Tax=Pedobacter sp. SYSU D00535 TaxID=2810308 RepID=UPI001A97BC6C|nr:glycosyltransferase [Pedobacter sp. SYSU D00535]
MNHICTWLCVDEKGEESYFPQSGKKSSSQSHQNIYWRCLIVFFITSKRFNRHEKHLLFTNAKTLPVVDGKHVSQILDDLGVKVIRTDFKYRTPKGYFGMFQNQFYEFSILEYIARNNKNPEDQYLILDSDCIFLKPADKLFAKAAENGFLSFEMDFPEDHVVHGLSRKDMKTVYEELLGQPVNEIPAYHMGEFFLASVANINKIFNDFQELWPRVYSWLKKEKIEVLHVHNWLFAASPSVFWAAKIARVPVVHTLHNYRLLCPSATLFHNGQLYLESLKRAFPWDAVFKGVYNNSKVLTFWVSFSIWLNRKLGTWDIIDRFILLSSHTKEVLEQSRLAIPANKFVIKPNFTNAVFLQEQFVPGDIFLFIGRLSEEKGVRVLLEAFAETGFHLRLIGTGPLKELVESYCDRYSHIEYLGFQGKEKIYTELKKATALVFPSVWYETFGLTIIESFAAGTPVIASKIGSAAFLIEDGVNGMHFEPGDVSDLKRRLNEWRGVETWRKKEMRNNCVNAYQQLYSPEKNRKELLGIYSRLTAPAVALGIS